MIDRLSEARTLIRAAFEDAAAGTGHVSSAAPAAQVDAARRVINAASAVQGFAGRAARRLGGGPDARRGWEVQDPGLGHVNEFAGCCLGPMLAISPAAAERRAHTAATWAAKLPATLAAQVAMAAGDLDPWRATLIADELGQAGAGACAAVEEQIYR